MKGTRNPSKPTGESAGHKETEDLQSQGLPPTSNERTLNGPKSFWSRLTDPQAAVVAALIAATVSLVAAGISVWSTSYTKELSNYNARLQRDNERSSKTDRAYEEAIRAIRHMKDQIQVVIADKNISVEKAGGVLREASAELDAAYESNASAITASDLRAKEVFHGTKSSARRSWNNLEAPNDPNLSRVTAEQVTALESIIGELSTAENELQEKYNSLTVK